MIQVGIIYDKSTLDERVAKSLANEFQHEAIKSAQNTISGRRNALVNDDAKWSDMRKEAASIRDEVLINNDYYIQEFTRNAEKRGSIVYRARTAQEALDVALDVVKETHEKLCLKAKSLLTEEIGINEYFEKNGVEVKETDCAEVILQTADSAPSHIVVPALHFDRARIRDLFQKKCGYTGSDEPEEITRFLRKELRPLFVKTQVGIAGCNFGVASTGTCTLVTNEGNGRMVSGFPKTLIVVMGIERMVPDLPDLDVMARLLVTSAVGTKMTSSFTLNTGPRLSDEGDGPESVHIILVDNGRSNILKSSYRSALRCIHCGACMNTCPVYRHIAGSGYGSIYPGPIGVVITPLLVGYDSVEKTPNACTLCGACADVCPVQVPLNSLIMRHRNDMVKQGYASKMEKRAFHLAASMLSHRRLYGALTGVGRIGMKMVGGKSHRLGTNTTWVPVLKGWTGARDLDIMERKFRTQFAQHERLQSSTTLQDNAVRPVDLPPKTHNSGVSRKIDPPEEESVNKKTIQQLSDQFIHEARSIGVEVSLAAPGEVANVIADQVRLFKGSRIALANDERLDAYNLEQTIKEAGWKTVRWNAARGAQCVKDVESCEVGISFCEAGIVASGTLAQNCDVHCGRAVSLLPSAHIGVVRKSSLVEHMAEYLKLLDAQSLPSCLVFITGPSNTADIELVRVVGVHGPLQTGIVLVDD